MALRALDNTMPAVVEERPKKVAKVAVPAAAAAKAASSPGSGRKKKKNDENSAPRATATATAAAGEQAVEYIPSEELEAVAPHPKAKAAGLVAELDSKDWIRVCEALNDARRLAIHHPALLNPIL
jgi:heparan-alpha-glucosaminide N-acetyltransferase